MYRSAPSTADFAEAPEVKAIKRKRTDDDEAQVRDIDVSVKRIRKCVPEEPYVLSISAAEPRYHYPSAQEAYSWCMGTPFEPHEEHLQYQTSVLREDPECFTQRSRVDIRRDEAAKIHNRSVSGAGTPMTNSSAKKKISLSDYKNKKASTGAGQKTEQIDPSKKPDAQKAHTNGVASHDRRGSGGESEQSKSNKRMLEEIERDMMSTFSDDSRDAQAAKKARRSLPSPVSAAKPTTHAEVPRAEGTEAAAEATGPKLKTEASTRGLPPLLSPLGDIPRPKLPPLLSPTLPPEIEAELKKQETRSHHAESDASAASEKLSKTKTEAKQQSASKSSEVKVEARSPILDPKPVPRVFADDLIEESDRHHRIAASTAAQVAERTKLIVKLRYGRRRRKDVERILRLRPLPQKKEESTETAKSSTKEEHNSTTSKQQLSKPTNNVNSIAQKPKQQPNVHTMQEPGGHVKQESGVHLKKEPISTSTTSTTTKRARQNEESTDDPPSKRPKAPKQLDLDKHPQTPNNKSQLLSPTVQQRSGSKSNTHLTPFKAAAMSRSSPLDGTSSTPQVATSTPPNTNSQDLRPPTSAPSGDAQAEIQDLNNARQKLNNLGRKLKREYDETFRRKASGETLSLAERRKGALKGLESVLCYILAFSCADASAKLRRSRLRLEDWKSVMPLHYSIVGMTKEFANLEGIRAMMGVAVTARVGSLLADTTTRPAAPPMSRAPSEQTSAGAEHHESPESTHSGATVAAPAGTASTNGTTDLAKDIADNFRALMHFMHEMNSKLNTTTIRDLFPRAWESRTETPPMMSWERQMVALVHSVAEVNGGETERELRKWYVGVDVVSSPVQAGLLGIVLLREVAQGGDAEGYEVEVEGALFER